MNCEIKTARRVVDFYINLSMASIRMETVMDQAWCLAPIIPALVVVEMVDHEVRHSRPAWPT